MEIVEVEITGQAITARYGTLSAGDILRTDKAYADHLVNDCGAAKYVKATVKPEPKPKEKPSSERAKARAKGGSSESVAAVAPALDDLGPAASATADPVQTSAHPPTGADSTDAAS